MKPHIHIICPEDSAFLEEKRKDPITGEVITNGQEVVFCALCRSVFLADSWAYLGNRHCGQSETLDFVPQSQQLIFNDMSKVRHVYFSKEPGGKNPDLNVISPLHKHQWVSTLKKTFNVLGSKEKTFIQKIKHFADAYIPMLLWVPALIWLDMPVAYAFILSLIFSLFSMISSSKFVVFYSTGISEKIKGFLWEEEHFLHLSEIEVINVFYEDGLINDKVVISFYTKTKVCYSYELFGELKADLYSILVEWSAYSLIHIDCSYKEALKILQSEDLHRENVKIMVH